MNIYIYVDLTHFVPCLNSQDTLEMRKKFKEAVTLRQTLPQLSALTLNYESQVKYHHGRATETYFLAHIQHCHQ